MKLIIDIPEEIYQNAKADFLCGSEIVVNAIKNGIPQEPKTDIEKIMAEIKQLPYQRIFGNVSSYSLLDTVIEIIDKYRQEGDMTREEAIRNINALNAVCGQKPFYDNKFEKALDMAVEALEQEPQWHEAEDPPSDDRLILLSFANYPVVAIGRYIGSEEEGGAFYIDSAEESLSSIGLIVNGWQELPKCKEV